MEAASSSAGRAQAPSWEAMAAAVGEEAVAEAAAAAVAAAAVMLARSRSANRTVDSGQASRIAVF